jgi:hypothetical protein
MKLLVLFLLQGFDQKRDNKDCFSKRKILEMPIFSELFSEGRFFLLCKVLHFVDDGHYEEAMCDTRLYKLKPIL